MIDNAKRKTLKRIGLGTATAATAALTSDAMAQVFADTSGHSPTNAEAETPIAHIRLNTRVSAKTNDIEVLITNAGEHSARITQMTPSETITKRGRFDFQSLMADGDLTLASGESISVPMTPHAVALNDSSNGTQRASSLNQALKRSFSVITENESFAQVTMHDEIRLFG